MPKKGVLFFQMIVMTCLLQAQTTICLQNPSFEEDSTQCGKLPSRWIDLGMPGETPPDIIQGSRKGRKATHGINYLGLSVRDNYTWEGIGQVLEGRMIQNLSYTFSLDLARWSLLFSESRLTGKKTFYAESTVLRIWGVDTASNTRELLAESEVIDHNKWRRYTFLLKPKKSSYDRLELVAYYAQGKERTNGGILLDNCSEINLLP